MKKFLSGVLCATLVFSLALSALAISGRMTIEVDPVNVQVNGEVFQPTDVNGKEVPVFAYQGTTYAPLRALAEAYGLEVGYDAATNMATVTDPEAKPEQPTTPDTTAKADYSNWSAEDEAAYQEFKGMWKISPRDGEQGYYASQHHDGQMVEVYDAEYVGNGTNDIVRSIVSESMKNGFCHRLADEIQSHNAIVRLWFYGPYENGMRTTTFDVFDTSWN